MNFGKTGKYVKHFNMEESPVLSFDADCKDRDNYYEAGKLCNTNGFQCVEKNKESQCFEFEYTDNGYIHEIHKYFNTILYSFYNIYGQRVKNMKVNFDFDNNTITINNRTVKVEESNEYTYKVLKTKVKAINGIKGLYKHILESMYVDSVFNCATWNVLAKIGNIEE